MTILIIMPIIRRNSSIMMNDVYQFEARPCVLSTCEIRMYNKKIYTFYVVYFYV